MFDKLAATDPRDNEISKGRFKTYLLPLEADKHYVIEQRSQELDCHLTLYDPKSQRIATDDNGAGGRDARILVKAAETGVYRLHASSAKDDAGEFAMRIWLNAGPFSVPTNEVVQTEKAQVGDASVGYLQTGEARRHVRTDLASRRQSILPTWTRRLFTAPHSSSEFVEEKKITGRQNELLGARIDLRGHCSSCLVEG